MVAAIWMFTAVAYGIVSYNDQDDDDSVTFTFPCSTVLAQRNSYPAEIVDACRRIQ
jgi:hypothetical protein